MYTKEMIKEKLSTDIRWMERGVIVLYNNQTEDEKEQQITKWENGIGFSGCDSRYLTYIAKYLLRGGHLSGHHIEKVSSKLPKYWKQIHQLIKDKEGR